MAKAPKSTGSSTQKLIRELAEILDETNLSEIELEESGIRVRVARTANVVASAAPAAAAAAPALAVAPSAAPAPAEDAAPADASSHPGAVKSPMVGTAYLSPEPGAAPFVKPGDQVKVGQTLMIVEAMKVMNPISAPRGGTLTEILVNDADPVEFDQPLVIIE